MFGAQGQMIPRDPKKEIIVVGFAGGGGSCEGIRQALGRSPDEALNHDPEAVAMHMANHPTTRHWCQNIWQALPSDVAAGRPIGLAWFSPDCKHFSKAKGKAPRSRNVRDLAWVVVAYAKLPLHLRPRVIALENVEEFQTWCPLLPDGQPDMGRKGETFQKWVGELKRLGYHVEWREIRAMEYGAPTIRKRFYLIARCDRQPVVWADYLNGPGRQDPYITASEIIDWSLPCPSIFNRKRPLATATLSRIAAGTMRYVIKSANPFIVSLDDGEAAPFFSTYYGQKRDGETRGCAGNGFLGTQTTENRHALVTAFLAKHYGGVIGHDVRRPLGAVTTIDHHSVVAAHLTRFHGKGPARDITEPVPTIETVDKLGVVAAHLTHFYSSAADGGNGDLLHPIKTVTGGGQHAGLVEAFLSKYCGIPANDLGLATVKIGGDTYVITDIGMRMLTPRELFRAQGFPDSYVIDIDFNGKPLSKAAQVRMCGNSVCPPVAKALVAANVPELAVDSFLEAA